MPGVNDTILYTQTIEGALCVTCSYHEIKPNQTKDNILGLEQGVDLVC